MSGLLEPEFVDAVHQRVMVAALAELPVARPPRAGGAQDGAVEEPVGHGYTILSHRQAGDNPRCVGLVALSGLGLAR